MTDSGFYLSLFFPVASVIFIALELYVLQLRRQGHKELHTMSQFIVKRIKEGSKGWLWFAVGFILFYITVMLWLVFHFQLPCFLFGELCKN